MFLCSSDHGVPWRSFFFLFRSLEQQVNEFDQSPRNDQSIIARMCPDHFSSTVRCFVGPFERALHLLSAFLFSARPDASRSRMMIPSPQQRRSPRLPHCRPIMIDILIIRLVPIWKRHYWWTVPIIWLPVNSSNCWLICFVWKIRRKISCHHRRSLVFFKHLFSHIMHDPYLTIRTIRYSQN